MHQTFFHHWVASAEQALRRGGAALAEIQGTVGPLHADRDRAKAMLAQLGSLIADEIVALDWVRSCTGVTDHLATEAQGVRARLVALLISVRATEASTQVLH